MAAVSLFWDTNMAAVTSCENTLLIILPINNVTGPTKQHYNAYIVMHGQIVVQSIAREMRH